MTVSTEEVKDMGKFTIREHGYDIKEVNLFLDQVLVLQLEHFVVTQVGMSL